MKLTSLHIEIGTEEMLWDSECGDGGGDFGNCWRTMIGRMRTRETMTAVPTTTSCCFLRSDDLCPVSEQTSMDKDDNFLPLGLEQGTESTSKVDIVENGIHEEEDELVAKLSSNQQHLMISSYDRLFVDRAVKIDLEIISMITRI
ncbi:hypothetical protein LXL04_003613 [Taraxacum kok-saghyz]